MEYLEYGETYILPNGTVIHVEQDIDASCPMAETDTPVYAYLEPRLSSSIYSNPPTDIVLKIFAEFVYRTDNDELSVELTKRYFGVFYPELADYANQLRLGHWQGYGQGDWLRYAYISEYDMSSEFGLYLQGDVSSVRIEYPNGELDYIGGISRELGRVTGGDIGLDISEARVANRTVIYS